MVGTHSGLPEAEGHARPMRHHVRRPQKQFRTTETAPVQCERDGDYFGAWCLFAVAITQGRCPHPTSQPPTVYSRDATGLGRSVANGRRMQFETRLFRSGSVVRFGVLRPGPSAHVGEGKPPPRKFHVGWAYGLLIVAGFCTWGGMLLLLCCNFCLPSRAPCWLGSAGGGIAAVITATQNCSKVRTTTRTGDPLLPPAPLC